MRRQVDWTLYLVTDRALCGARTVEEVVAAAVRGGVTAVQLRDKSASTRELVDLGRSLKAVLDLAGVPLLINDRVDVALACGAAGVHVGQTDLHCRDARRILGNGALIGLSVENERQAAQAEDWDVDYLAVSPVFATPTKTDVAPSWGLERLTALRKSSRHEIVAIGGLNQENATQIARTGANGIAVISAICASPDPESAARALRRAFTAGVQMSAGEQRAHLSAHLPRKRYFRTLTIAGSDSGGGAGIQGDLKTFSALGCYGMSALTALTAQNTTQVCSIFDVSPSFVKEQLDAVLSDIGVDAVKVGMLHAPDVIRAVAERLKRYEIKSIVVDPVMVAKSGDRLLRDDAIESLKEELFPLARVITPNLPEASVLLGRNVQTPAEMEKAAVDLLRFGPEFVVIKGGHAEGSESSDYFLSRGGDEQGWIRSTRVVTLNTHGTGCTFSSAIAAFLARGLSPVVAIREAKSYLTGAILAGAGYRLGEGHGPVHHFYQV